MLQQIAVRIEYADEAVPRLVDRIVLRPVLQRIGNPQIAVDRLDPEGRVSVLHFWIAERPRHGSWSEDAVEDVDFCRSGKLVRVQQRPFRATRCQRQAFVNCAGRAAAGRARGIIHQPPRRPANCYSAPGFHPVPEPSGSTPR